MADATMKALASAALVSLLLSCSPEPTDEVAEPAGEANLASGTGSFRMRNGEIRDEIIQMIEDANIEYWLGDDGNINYNLADGEAIDKIGNEVISEYITRN